MNRPRFAALALAAALITSGLAAQALASDFYRPSPVPSSRDNIKPAAKTTAMSKQSQEAANNAVLNRKIVRTTKPADDGSTTPRGKTPGAL